MGHTTLRGAFLGLAVAVVFSGGGTRTAHAGTVLLARESSIRASGTAGSGDFDLTDGSHDFNGFADMVDTSSSGVTGPRAAANQHSRPALSAADGFTGAFAEGSASAALAEGAAPADVASALSNFDLTFEVLGVPSMVTFGGSVGVSGNGSTSVELSNETTGEVLLAQELLAGEGESQSIEHSTLLLPGVYELSVAASVNGEPNESMAYYAVNLMLAPVTGSGVGPTPIPLPPALWSAAAVFGAGAATRGWRRLTRRGTR